MKYYLVSVANNNIDLDIHQLGEEQWVKQAFVGSYYHETDRLDVIQSYYDKILKRQDCYFEPESNTFIYKVTNWRCKVIDFEEITLEMAEVLRQCE
jgi:hypothetical protein